MIQTFSTSDGLYYEVDEYGVIHQRDYDVIEYDAEYGNKYNDPEYLEKGKYLSGIRLANVLTAWSIRYGVDSKPSSLLDVGYGSGQFLGFANEGIEHCYGMDVTGLDVPDGCIKIDDYQYADIVTYWDVFEHIEDLTFIKDLKAKIVVMSMPDVHGKDFDTWKHRRPNEHLHHFTPESLSSLMNAMGWRSLFCNHSEDAVRKGEYRNILTMAFCRKE